MYVIYSQLRDHIQLISWTSSLDIAKQKLEEYALKHLQILDPEATHTIDDGIATRDETNEIADVVVETAELVPKFSAKHIIGEVKRNRDNIRQINLYSHGVITGWTTFTKTTDMIGYFAISQVNQAANLYPISNSEMEEVRKDLEQEKIVVAASR